MLTPLELPKRFETERLYLRCFQQTDAPMYYRISQKNRDHLKRYEAGNSLMSINSEADAAVVIKGFIDHWEIGSRFYLAVFKKDSDEFVAQIYIGTSNRLLPEFELGYIVNSEHEGNGYVTEAAKASIEFIFKYLKAHRIRLECDDTNQRSRKVAERCGFILEGHSREDKKNSDGTITGTLFFGLLKSEFEAK
jgi:[ribosomal protein S5]-alanine N-acetyltransferase